MILFLSNQENMMNHGMGSWPQVNRGGVKDWQADEIYEMDWEKNMAELCLRGTDVLISVGSCASTCFSKTT